METLKLRVYAKNQLNSVLIEELKNIIPQLKKIRGAKNSKCRRKHMQENPYKLFEKKSSTI